MQLIVLDFVKNVIKYMVLAPDKFESGCPILLDMTSDHPCFLSSVDICRYKDYEFFFANVAAVPPFN